MLALIYAAVIFSSIILLLIFFYNSTFVPQLEEIDQQITQEINDLVNKSTSDGHLIIDLLFDQVNQKVVSRPTTNLTLYALVSNKNQFAGNLVEFPSTVKIPDRENQMGDWFQFDFWAVAPPASSDSTDGTHQGRARIMRFSNEKLGWFNWRTQALLENLNDGELKDISLLVGRDVDDILKLRSLLNDFLEVGIFMTLALSIIAAILTSRVVSRRLVRINTTCHLVMEGDLSQRIVRNNSNDGIDQLAYNFNRMLDRIEVLMEGIRSVSDNIAHDLKTPITRIKNRLDRFSNQSENRQPNYEQIQRLIDSTIQDTDLVLETFAALLRIARVETDTMSNNFTSFEPQNLIDDVVGYYEPLAEKRAITLKILADSSGTTIYADRDLVFQALANLIDNAIKYTPENGSITIRGFKREDGFEVEIADRGPGIPAKFHEKVCQRFYRLDSSRSSPGNGLGLSLVAAVAKLHGVELIFEDHDPGLRVRLKQFKYADDSPMIDPS